MYLTRFAFVLGFLSLVFTVVDLSATGGVIHMSNFFKKAQTRHWAMQITRSCAHQGCPDKTWISGYPSSTRPKGHWPRGTLSLAISTKSPLTKFLRCFSHFWRSCSVSIYSLIHRHQNTLARYCACRQRLILAVVMIEDPRWQADVAPQKQNVTLCQGLQIFRIITG